MERTREIWNTSLIIANACFVLLISIAGLMLMAGTSLPRETGLRELLPRVVLAFLAVNLSQFLISQGIRFANGLSGGFLVIGQHKIDPEQAAEVMGRSVESAVNGGPVFLILVALVVVVLALVVVVIYIARLMITMVLIAAAPLALMFHALPATEQIALLWWRAITGVLAIQVCQALVFVSTLQILLSTDPDAKYNTFFSYAPTTKKDGLDLLLLICLLYMLIRIPSWVARTIWRQAIPRLPTQVLKTLLIYRGTSAVLRSARTRRHRPRRGRGGGGTGPGGGRSRGPRPGGGGRSGSGPGPRNGNSGGRSPGGSGNPGGHGSGPGSSDSGDSGPNGPSPRGSRADGRSGARPGPLPNGGPSPSGGHRQASGAMPGGSRPRSPAPSGVSLPASRTRPVPRAQRHARAEPPRPRQAIALRLEPHPRRPTGRRR
ncbi:hypothetical protein [Actinomadura craniellae]|nr:hypothetical protein [Actinomadura craniellae]